MENLTIIANSSQKRLNSKTKQAIWALLGLLILVGGVLAGTFLVKENQDFRERAAGIERTPQPEQEVTSTK